MTDADITVIRNDQMLVNVLYNDKKIGLVLAERIDTLVNENRIIAFRRSSGWVIVGQDPMRRENTGNDFPGPERRNLHGFAALI